jgi:short subunit dehydrogenase-like uncharacterized protein
VPDADRPLAVFGATGYTGGLVCAKARELGIPLRLVGRRREALDAMADPGEDVRVADARDAPALRAAFDGAFAVVSCATAFLDQGAGTVAAALEVGTHYLDTSGEQAFARVVYDRFGPEAKARGVVLLTSFGFDYVPGDLAARCAAEGLGSLDEIVVAYSVAGVASSRGTRQTVARIMRQPLVAWSGGRLVESRFGATTRRVRFPFGERDVVEWGGTEPLSVPRHTEVREVRSYVRGPRIAAAAAPLTPLLAPLVRLTASIGTDPTEEKRREGRFAVVAEARGQGGGRRVTLTGTDVYGLTALLIGRGAEALRNGEARGAGALAPSEAFDARAFIERLAPLLVLEPAERL